MRKPPQLIILGFFFTLPSLSALGADRALPLPAPAVINPVAPSPVPTGLSPDETLKKIADLIGTGNYAAAQQTTTALLMLYPNDQRLINTKIQLDQLLAPPKPVESAPSATQGNSVYTSGGQTDTTSATDQPTTAAKAAPPTLNSK